MADAGRGAFTAEAEAAAADLVEAAMALARTRGISPYVVPEILLLAALDAAARIDGTAEGTVDWIRNVAARLDDAAGAGRPDAPVSPAS